MHYVLIYWIISLWLQRKVNRLGKLFQLSKNTTCLEHLLDSSIKSIKIIEFTEINKIELTFVALDRIISNQN